MALTNKLTIYNLICQFMFRIIPPEIRNAFMNMALDEACMEAVQSGKAPLTVRFYRWQPSAVSIGTFQSMKDEVAVEICRQQGIDVVRRRTGGGAVYHDTEGEITYSVIGREDLFPTDIIESYELICNWIIAALKLLGIKEASFHPINDILAYGKKISGNAQTRRKGILLQHGTILFDVDVRKMFSFLTVGQDKLADKMIAAVEDRVTSVQNLLPKVKRDQVEKVLLECFQQGVGAFSYLEGQQSGWSEDELARAEQLIQERYGRDEWNYMR